MCLVDIDFELNQTDFLALSEFDLNQGKFLALANKLDIISQKRKLAPEADEDNEEVLPPSKRARTEGSYANREDEEREVRSRRRSKLR